MSPTHDQIRQKLLSVQGRIAAAAERAGRPADDVRLVVVTKAHPVEVVKEVVRAGARILGENYADEALPKIAALEGQEVTWHMIGHIQSRKSRMVAENFSMVHSLDSVKLARRLHSAWQGAAPLPALVQVNVSGEDEKFGLPAWESGSWREVHAVLQEMKGFTHLRLAGLMTVPPYLPPEEVRPYFKKLVELRDRLQDANPDLQLTELSMGMSGDFEVAVEEGATLVRVGTAILGPR